MKCIYHNERDAEYVCAVCGQPICRECITMANGRNICRACAYKAAQYNNVPYKRGDGVNSFLFFIFLAVPGMRHMYLGLMKRGFEFLVAFFGSIAVSFLLGSIGEILIPIFFIIWFYSAFDSYHCRKLIAKGEEVEDSSIFKGYSFDYIKEFFIQRRRLTGYSIISLGIFMLLRQFRSYSWRFHIPEAVITTIDMAFDSIIPILLIAGGVYLLSRYKKSGSETVENE